MRKFSLAALLLFASLAQSIAQTDSTNIEDTDSTYEKKYLTIDEVNFVGSYYTQDGNNSAVTGGIGTEQLTDFSNNLDIQLSKIDKKGRTHNISLEMGFDTYTSASSDKVNPLSISSASSNDQRYYPSVNWSMTNPNRHNTIGAGAYYSGEYDYQSIGLSAQFAQASKNENTEISLKANVFFDSWKVILPVELRQRRDDEGNSPRYSQNLQIAISQVLTPRLQVAFVVEPSFQQGLLGTKFHRVYFTDSSLKSENLPDQRWKLPMAVRANAFLGDNFIFRGFYRYYIDQWGMQAHTAMLEAPVRIGNGFTIGPFGRWYDQKGVKYFAGYMQHQPSETYFTSDYDLSTFTSWSVGGSARLAPVEGVFGVAAWSSLELRYEYYERSTGLKAQIVSLGMKFKPNFAPMKAIEKLF